MAFDLFRAILRHETDNDAADHGGDDNPKTQLCVLGTAEMKRPLVVVSEIGEKAD